MAVQAIMAGGMAVAQGYSAYTQAKADEEAQDAYNKQLTEDAIRQYGELDEVEDDIIYESHAQSLQAQKQLLLERSDLFLRAAHTGTYGGTVDLALKDIGRGFSSRMSEITDNKDRNLESVVKQAEEIHAGTKRNYDTTLRRPAWFSGAMGALQGAQAGSSLAGSLSGVKGSGRAVPKRKTDINIKTDASQINTNRQYA